MPRLPHTLRSGPLRRKLQREIAKVLHEAADGFALVAYTPEGEAIVTEELRRRIQAVLESHVDRQPLDLVAAGEVPV